MQKDADFGKPILYRKIEIPTQFLKNVEDNQGSKI